MWRAFLPAATGRMSRKTDSSARASGHRPSVQDEASLNVQLQCPVSEAVTVAAIRPLINVTSGSVGTVVDREFVANMPLNGRSFQSLIALTPGVVVTAATSAAQGQFSVNGQRADANYFMVDGVSANVGISPSGAQNSSGTGSGIQTNAFGAYSNFVSVDAMQEFRIETSSFAPEYGRLPGGQSRLSPDPGRTRSTATSSVLPRHQVRREQLVQQRERRPQAARSVRRLRRRGRRTDSQESRVLLRVPRRTATSGAADGDRQRAVARGPAERRRDHAAVPQCVSAADAAAVPDGIGQLRSQRRELHRGVRQRQLDGRDQHPRRRTADVIDDHLRARQPRAIAWLDSIDPAVGRRRPHAEPGYRDRRTDVGTRLDDQQRPPLQLQPHAELQHEPAGCLRRRRPAAGFGDVPLAVRLHIVDMDVFRENHQRNLGRQRRLRPVEPVQRRRQLLVATRRTSDEVRRRLPPDVPARRPFALRTDARRLTDHGVVGERDAQPGTRRAPSRRKTSPITTSAPTHKTHGTRHLA